MFSVTIMSAQPLLFFLLAGIFIQSVYSGGFWVWKCDSNKGLCTRTTKESENILTTYPTVEVCRLCCGNYGSLWPRPTNFTRLGNQLLKFPLSSLALTIAASGDALDLLKENEKYFYGMLSSYNTTSCHQLNPIKINVNVNSSNIDLDWTTDESYTLNIQSVQNELIVTVLSESAYGARHALETLLQLIEFYPDNQERCFVILTDATIYDRPIYSHRGLLIDTARNFQNVNVIKRHLNAMAASKLNTLHWHITDTQSFPLVLPDLPQMAQFGSYSNKFRYTTDDVANIKKYAQIRGIRVVIEIDTPSHAGNGWQWGPSAGLGNLAVCINQQPWRENCIQPPCGQLNPANPNVYKVLKMLYKNIVEIPIKTSVFHMGGDEVFIPCWNSTQEIIDYLHGRRNSESFLNLWGEFQAKALQVFDENLNEKIPIILWTSALTNTTIITKYLDKNRYVIQTWVPRYDTLPEELIKLGYRIIVSTKDAWYLDHGFWGTTQYHDWRTIYDNQLPNPGQCLGGEVCMWGEYVDSVSVEARTWPRAAAAAERLWSNGNRRSDNVQSRFIRHRERLNSRGIKADAVVPKWCYQNEGQCN